MQVSTLVNSSSPSPSPFSSPLCDECGPGVSDPTDATTAVPRGFKLWTAAAAAAMQVGLAARLDFSLPSSRQYHSHVTSHHQRAGLPAGAAAGLPRPSFYRVSVFATRNAAPLASGRLLGTSSSSLLPKTSLMKAIRVLERRALHCLVRSQIASCSCERVVLQSKVISITHQPNLSFLLKSTQDLTEYNTTDILRRKSSFFAGI